MNKTLESASTPSYDRVGRDTVGGQVFDSLRRQIIDGTLRRGAKLPTEKNLAESYGVSGATIREAVRALTAMQLVKVRHGSGAYVTADVESLIGMSLESMIQMERIGVPDVLGILGILDTYAAELAASRATAEEIDGLTAALDLLDAGESIDTMVKGLSTFLAGLAAASHNPLLAALCKFLSLIQIQLARELFGVTAEEWRMTTASLARERRDLVHAIAQRDAAKAGALSRVYHQNAINVIMALPHADAARLTDPKLVQLLSSLIGKIPG